MEFVDELRQALQVLALPENAAPMAAYMKDKFTFLGVRTTERRAVFRELTKKYKPEIDARSRDIARQLFQMQEREFHYCAVEVLMLAAKNGFTIEDIVLFEWMATTHSWWDTVDFIAKYLVGGYLEQFPEKTDDVISHFSTSGNMWLIRTSILCQLGYKDTTNALLLYQLCNAHKGSKEFFIRKAIGWALREYAKTDPEAVRKYVATADLAPLSAREALKNL